ncbi:DAK2 domain-containing protein, partial [Pseudonocardia kongjuensis]|uniref:DAK2 domain-containing protein n=1 Tax=Pseudonocardia kongjuensis TaxID=102227 RepID=UPI003CD0BF7D
MAPPFDPALLRRWIDAAAERLTAGRAEIDRINVFPVADHDTGSNLLLTARAAASAPLEGGPARAAAALAAAAVRGARGNSGLILSQLFRGLAEELAATPAEGTGGAGPGAPGAGPADLDRAAPAGVRDEPGPGVADRSAPGAADVGSGGACVPGRDVEVGPGSGAADRPGSGAADRPGPGAADRTGPCVPEGAGPAVPVGPGPGVPEGAGPGAPVGPGPGAPVGPGPGAPVGPGPGVAARARTAGELLAGALRRAAALATGAVSAPRPGTALTVLEAAASAVGETVAAVSAASGRFARDPV